VNDLKAAEAEITRLRIALEGVVPAAFEEGFKAGRSTRYPVLANDAWMKSQARSSLPKHTVAATEPPVGREENR